MDTIKQALHLRRLAIVCLRHCNEESKSSAPWAIRNLRIWQNMYSKALADRYEILINRNLPK